MTPEEQRNANMGWFEVAARLKGNPILQHRECVSLEAVKADGSSLRDGDPPSLMSGLTKVGFLMRSADVYKSGPRKGERKWVKGSDVFEFVTREDADAAMRAYETETGKCGRCKEGQEPWGWSSTEGSRYRTCGRCKGTGAKP